MLAVMWVKASPHPQTTRVASRLVAHCTLSKSMTAIVFPGWPGRPDQYNQSACPQIPDLHGTKEPQAVVTCALSTHVHPIQSIRVMAQIDTQHSKPLKLA